MVTGMSVALVVMAGSIIKSSCSCDAVVASAGLPARARKGPKALSLTQKSPAVAAPSRLLSGGVLKIAFPKARDAECSWESELSLLGIPIPFKLQDILVPWVIRFALGCFSVRRGGRGGAQRLYSALLLS